MAPWQQYAYKRREMGLDISEEGSMSLGQSVPNLRTNKLLDSGVSGGITGGLLRGLLCKPSVIRPSHGSLILAYI